MLTGLDMKKARRQSLEILLGVLQQSLIIFSQIFVFFNAILRADITSGPYQRNLNILARFDFYVIGNLQIVIEGISQNFGRFQCFRGNTYCPIIMCYVSPSSSLDEK